MALIDHYDVPMCLLDIVTEHTIVLECVNGYDSLVVVFERVLVCRNLRTDPIHADTVQSDKRNCKTIPHFFLELCKYRLQGDDENSLSLTSLDELR